MIECFTTFFYKYILAYTFLGVRKQKENERKEISMIMIIMIIIALIFCLVLSYQ